MEYRVMNKLDETASLLGMGGMRFPTDETGKIDYPASEKMLDECMKSGINYYDTAYIYHNGESEVLFREALVKRYPRDSFKIATKLPIGDLKNREDLTRVFDEQMIRLGVDTIDFYLLHCLTKNIWKNAQKLDAYDFISSKKDEGKVKHIGFSFHDSPDLLREILQAKKWDFVLLQINYIDWDDYAEQCYNIASEFGLPIMVMEPIRGGSLAMFPDDIKEIFTNFDPSKSQASLALRWVGSLPNVNVILSGMSTLEQCKENIETFNNFTPLNSDEYEVISQAIHALKQKPTIPCTECGYCLTCPAKVAIPNIFTAYNTWVLYENLGGVKFNYYIATDEKNRPEHCIKCGKCLSKCPQHIDIPTELEKSRVFIEDLCR